MSIFLILAAVNGLLVVLLGAFGAHGLEALLTADRLEVYNTAVQYHMFHVLGLVVCGLLLKLDGPDRRVRASGHLFQLGIVLFSGSLYLLALTGISGFGMVTPLGGIAFLLGWGLLARALVRQA